MKLVAYLFLLVAGVLLFLEACEKQARPGGGPQDLVARAKEITDVSRLYDDGSVIHWDGAVVKKVRNIDVLVVPLKYKKPAFCASNLDPSRLYNLDYLRVLVFYKGEDNTVRAELLRFFPDSNAVSSLQFSGILRVENLSGELLKTYKYEPGSAVKELSEQTASAAEAKNASVKVCYTATGYNYSTDNPSGGYNWQVDLGCDQYFFNDNAGSGGTSLSGNDYTTVPGLPGTGGGIGTGAGASVPNLIIPGGDNIIGNIIDYNKCFINTAGAASEYTVTLCVAQPIPGVRETWGFNAGRAGVNGTPFNVGHTFLVLTQTGVNGTITRNVGFYPQSNVTPLHPSGPGQLNNDAQHDFNISLTIVVDNSQFFSILNFISHGNDAGTVFDLNSNNCTSFALNALGAAGIFLHVTPGTWPGGQGYDPGDLGEDIRNMVPGPAMTKNTSHSNHPNKGDCY